MLKNVHVDLALLFNSCIPKTVLFCEINKSRLDFKQTDDTNYEHQGLKNKLHYHLFYKDKDNKCILVNTVKLSIIHTHRSWHLLFRKDITQHKTMRTVEELETIGISP